MGKTAGMLLAGLLVASGTVTAMAAVGNKGADAAEAAKGPRDRVQQSYLQRLDVDRDGAVTIEEYLRRRTGTFTRRDENRDGTLDEAELMRGASGWRGRTMESRLERIFDGSGQTGAAKLTLAAFENELAASGRRPLSGAPTARILEQRQRLVAYYDQNADGVVEKSEFEAARAEVQAYRKRRAMHVLDHDGDGRVTLEEYTADARARFQRLDLNRDGRITAADLHPLARQQWSQR